MTVVERFDAKVTKTESCWLWTGAINGDGYGRFFFQGRNCHAHRIAYALYVGDPDGQQVLHSCDVRNCVRPSHLFKGSQLDNINDMVAKGRHRNGSHLIRGESNPGSKLTRRQVAAIRRSKGCHQEIAERYGVSRSLIGQIKNGKVWSS